MTTNNKLKSQPHEIIIWAAFFIAWISVIFLSHNLNIILCNNYVDSHCETFSWIIKIMNALIVFNLLAIVEVFTTLLRIKNCKNKIVTFSKCDYLYVNYVKATANKFSSLDNVFKKFSLSGINKPGRYLGFLLFKYLK